jgi:uracil-DNA glycosylase
VISLAINAPTVNLERIHKYDFQGFVSNFAPDLAVMTVQNHRRGNAAACVRTGTWIKIIHLPERLRILFTHLIILLGSENWQSVANKYNSNRKIKKMNNKQPNWHDLR